MVEEIRMFPRWFYKQGEEPTLVASEEEAQALGAGWSDETPARRPGQAPAAMTAAPPPPPVPDEEGEEEGSGEGSSRRRR